MIDGKQLWYSFLQFQPNPNFPSEGALDLGFALEFTTSKYWVMGLAIRATLEEKYLATLDDLTRRLLEERMAIMTREVEQTLNKADQPGDALTILAARNPWSIHVSAPRSLTISPSEQKASDKATTEKATEQYLFKIFEKEAGKAAPTGSRDHAVGALTYAEMHDEEEDDGCEAGALWMYPPKTLIRPLSGVHA